MCCKRKWKLFKWRKDDFSASLKIQVWKNKYLYVSFVYNDIWNYLNTDKNDDKTLASWFENNRWRYIPDRYSDLSYFD